MKAVFITNQGVCGFNLADNELSLFELGEAYESRIEIICDDVDATWEESLVACLVS